jgi:hypothetical protein
MWTNIVAAMVLLVIATWLIERLLLGKRKGPARDYVTRDIVPIIAFFGFLILALSFVEALHRDVVAAWGLGIACGLLMCVVVWIALGYRERQPARARVSGVRAVWRYLRTYGLTALFVILGIYLAIRFIGVVVGIFVASALGALMLSMAIAVFAGARRRGSEQ